MVERGRITLDHNNTLERMKMSKGGFGAWNLVEFS
jgi:hypothetical protein